MFFHLRSWFLLLGYGFSFGASRVAPLEMRDPWIAPGDLSKMSLVPAPKSLHWHCSKMNSSRRTSKFLARYMGTSQHPI